MSANHLPIAATPPATTASTKPPVSAASKDIPSIKPQECACWIIRAHKKIAINARKGHVFLATMVTFHPSLMSALTVEPIVRVVQKLHVKFVFPNIMLIQMVNVHSALINAIHVLMKRNV